MKLYNTLTKQIDEVVPQQSHGVTVYTCGPTVYDYAHIGHWFTYIRMDTLIRALKVSGLQPKWVMNITDVGHLVSDADEGEDKLEKGAKREGKTAWEVADFYTTDFLDCMKLLNIYQPDVMPKATDHIAEQIALIQVLGAKDFTYVIDDGVYFDTSKFPTYADFAHLDLAEQQEGARVTINKEKRNASDFALWKFSPSEQHRDMEWDSPWGKGFPGWHIECSAMSMKYLGETLDIHTGGIDHVPVHHTNEIAQSEAATGKRFANLWFHTNHVMVNGEKISKSLENGIRLQEILDKGISTQAIRLNVLESHYRKQAQFSWESLEAAQNRLNNLQAVAALRWQAIPNSNALLEDYSLIIESDIMKPLLNDLNTPQVLANINSRAAIVAERLLTSGEVADFTAYLQCIDDVFGLGLMDQQDISNEQKSTILTRETARQNQDWATSDELRDTLAEQGIGVRDTGNRTTWFRL